MIHAAYLDTLPELPNEYGILLQEGERVVFTAELAVFGDEKDQVLGLLGSKFTLTNQRIIADNGPGVWTVNILDEVIGWTKVITPKRLFFRESVYFLVTLNHDIVFEGGKRRLGGFHFYFKKDKTMELEEIVKYLQA